MSYKVGEKVVYPNHGVTVVEMIGDSDFAGANNTYLHLRLLSNNSRLMVPVGNSERVGLRPLYRHNQIKSLFSLLEERPAHASRDWKDRYRDNLEKMKSGRLEDVADVLKNLTQVSKRKSLSFREKKMYERAKHLLVSEIAVVKGIEEKEAEALIEKSLDKSLSALTGH